MGEVLSQNEIDSLLQALSTGELDVDEMKSAPEKSVKNYDFKRPAKFSKEHLRTLEIIFEHYGRLLSTNLPVYLRKTVQVSVASSETVTFFGIYECTEQSGRTGHYQFRTNGGRYHSGAFHEYRLCNSGSYAGRRRKAPGEEQGVLRD